MTLEKFSSLSKKDVESALFSCCGSSQWVKNTVTNFPFKNEQDLLLKATNNWYDSCGIDDYLESFNHHPEIGDIKSLQEKFARKEQASISHADQKTIEALAKANFDYKSKFGFIFIICATGKSAIEMLNLLQARLKNNIEEERNIAMGEQMKITIIRFQKLIPEGDWSFLKVSQLTTHVLDTSIGKPGKDILIRLQKLTVNGWQTFSQGITNNDGRIADLLPQNKILSSGNYNLAFDTDSYFKAQNLNGFYPEVNIQFTVFDEAHYHVPLLINPFGYSTYRGS
jgi:5-hydroxyisourate hydrolase/2-oxo-4-hydroxy-4-carboxy-5-ureidoimidazoline decarboxylase